MACQVVDRLATHSSDTFARVKRTLEERRYRLSSKKDSTDDQPYGKAEPKRKAAPQIMRGS